MILDFSNARSAASLLSDRLWMIARGALLGVCAIAVSDCSRPAGQRAAAGESVPELPPAAIFRPNGDLRVSIDVRPTIVSVGEQPMITARFENVGTGDLSLVRPRVPGLYVDDANGRPVRGCSEAFNGAHRYIPAITAADTIRLSPSTSLETELSPKLQGAGTSVVWPFGCGSGPQNLPPGTYRVRFVYDNYPDLPYLRYDPSAMPAQLWEGRIAAAPITLQVVRLGAAAERDLIARLTRDGAAEAEIALLGLQNTPAAADALLDRFRSRPADRLVVLQALNNTADPAVLATLLSAIQQFPPEGSSPDWWQVLSRLIRTHGDCSVWPFFERALEMRGGDLDYMFGETVGEVATRCPSMAAELRKVLTDPQQTARTRGNAALLLGRFQQHDDAVLMGALVRELSNGSTTDGVDPVRTAVIRGLALVRGSVAQTVLAEMVDEVKQTSTIQSSIAAALGNVGGAAAVPALTRLARSPDSQVAVRALLSLGQVGDRSAVPELVQLMKHKNPTLRSYAASALRVLADESVRPVMRAAVDDPDRNVRMNALFYLAEQGDSTALPLFERYAGSSHQYLQEGARAGLRRVGTAASAGSIRKFLESPAEAVRRSTVLALEYLTFRPWAPKDGTKELNPSDFDAWWVQNRIRSRREWALAALDRPHRFEGGYSAERTVKIAALTYLAAASDRTLLPVFARQAQNWDWAVRVAAGEAIAVVDRRAAARWLIRELDARFVGGCLRAANILKELTKQSVSVDCYDPASRRDAKARWTSAVATVNGARTQTAGTGTKRQP